MKIIKILLVVLLTLSVCGCTPSGTPENPSNPTGGDEPPTGGDNQGGQDNQNGNQDPKPAELTIDELFARLENKIYRQESLNGYFCIFYEGNVFTFGLENSGFILTGTASKLVDNKDGTYTLTVDYPAFAGNEEYDAYDAYSAEYILGYNAETNTFTTLKEQNTSTMTMVEDVGMDLQKVYEILCTYNHYADDKLRMRFSIEGQIQVWFKGDNEVKEGTFESISYAGFDQYNAIVKIDGIEYEMIISFSHFEGAESHCVIIDYNDESHTLQPIDDEPVDELTLQEMLTELQNNYKCYNTKDDLGVNAYCLVFDGANMKFDYHIYNSDDMYTFKCKSMKKVKDNLYDVAVILEYKIYSDAGWITQWSKDATARITYDRNNPAKIKMKCKALSDAKTYIYAGKTKTYHQLGY